MKKTKRKHTNELCDDMLWWIWVVVVVVVAPKVCHHLVGACGCIMVAVPSHICASGWSCVGT